MGMENHYSANCGGMSSPHALVAYAYAKQECVRHSLNAYCRVEAASGPGFKEPNNPCSLKPRASAPGEAAKYRALALPPLPPLPHCRPHSPLMEMLLPLPSCMVPK